MVSYCISISATTIPWGVYSYIWYIYFIAGLKNAAACIQDWTFPKIIDAGWKALAIWDALVSLSFLNFVISSLAAHLVKLIPLSAVFWSSKE